MNMIDRPRLALLRHHGCHGAAEVSSFGIREERIGRARIDRARILAAPFQPKCRVPTSIVERSIVDGHTRSGLNLAFYVFDTLPDRIDNLENFVVFPGPSVTSCNELRMPSTIVLCDPKQSFPNVPVKHFVSSRMVSRVAAHAPKA